MNIKNVNRRLERIFHRLGKLTVSVQNILYLGIQNKGMFDSHDQSV